MDRDRQKYINITGQRDSIDVLCKINVLIRYDGQSAYFCLDTLWVTINQPSYVETVYPA